MGTLNDDLAFVIDLAREVADIARSRSHAVKPQEKENLSYVTDLDHFLENLIRERLAKEFPNDVLTGEEYAPSGGTGQRKWSIDPIDGTGNLVHQLPLWAVSIGLIDQGEPVLGVIVIPPLRETFWATKGGGAWKDGVQLHVKDRAEIHQQDNICVGTNALRAIDTRTIPGRIRDLGSACCELSFVACGRLAACTFLGEHTHDVAAGAVIVSEAGCQFATIDGKYLSPTEMVANTPVSQPTFIAPPLRLARLISQAKLLV